MPSSLEPLIPGGLEANAEFTDQLWSGISRDSIDRSLSLGYGFTEKFILLSGFATTVAQGRWYPFQDTSDTINSGAVLGGGLILATAATDNNSPTIQAGGTTGSCFSISKTTPKALGFEVCFKVGQITETGLLIALGEEGMAANNGCLVDDTGAGASKSYIGFRAGMGASSCVLSAVYRKSGQAEVVALTTALTTVASTSYTVGFRYRARGTIGEWWVNGAIVKSLNFSDTTAVPTATCPFDITLSPVICLKTGESGAKSLTLKGLAVYQKL